MKASVAAVCLRGPPNRSVTTDLYRRGLLPLGMVVNASGRSRHEARSAVPPPRLQVGVFAGGDLAQCRSDVALPLMVDVLILGCCFW